MKFLFIAVFTLLFFVPALSQVEDNITTLELKQELIPIRIAYFGNMAVNPGFKIGADWNCKEVKISKTKKRNNKTKDISKLLLINVNTALYNQPTTMSGWLSSIEIGRRRTKNEKWYIEPKIGIGALTRFNKGETYDVEENGTTTYIGNSSNTYFAPTLSLGFGRNLTLNDHLYSPYINLQSYSAVGMNATTVPDLALEIGIRFHPTVRLKRNLHHIRKISK